MKRELTDMQRDALREISSISAGNATTALSKLMNRRVDVIIPQIDLLPIRTVPEMLGGKENLATAVHAQIIGDAVMGSMGVLFERKSSFMLVDMIRNKPLGTTKELDKMCESTLTEMGIIMTETSLQALSQFLDMKLTPAKRAVASDMVSALMDNVLIDFARHSEYVVVLSVEFSSPPTTVRGKFLLIFDVTTLESILNAIEKKISYKEVIKNG